MKIAILSRSPQIYSTRRLIEAVEKAGHEVILIDHTKCHLIMEKGKPSIRIAGEEIKGIDVIIPRIGASVTTYGAAVIRHFDLMGVPSILTSTALIRSRDKLRSLQVISKSGIGIPKSVFARHPKADEVKALIQEVGGTPVILKLLEGTHGTGVIKADSVSSAKSAVEAFSGIKRDLIVQEFIEEAGGKDIRAFVVDGEVVGAMERSGQADEFRSNLHKGGVARAIEIDKKIKSTALEATKLLGLTVGGVDLLLSSRGPLVIEVNSSPGLQGIERATGFDIAGKIIEAALKKVAKDVKDKDKAKLKKRKKKIKKDNRE
ncbi:MAG: ribosomal protein S6--L-glutamate ligase [Candidatus Parcubacteria bacterium]|jgi:ribosomal protein S6--L-glutamate ligase